jgi:hypothetical protein
MANELKTPDHVGRVEGQGLSIEDIIRSQIAGLASKYAGSNSAVANILSEWHASVTLGMRRNPNFSPHVNGFYMIHMISGTWYDRFKDHQNNYTEPLGISSSTTEGILKNTNPFYMMATDIEVPDLTEEYVSVSSRIRNSFIPSRNYFVADFNVSYIENVNLEVIRYHEAWLKYLDLLKRGEVNMYNSEAECKALNPTDSVFLDMPFTNAVWVTVFEPFTTNIQLLIKLIGVMPVNIPLKQIVGNRSQSKMTVLNMQYKAADMFYKFYNGTEDLLADNGELAKAYKREVLGYTPTESDPYDYGA